MILCEDLAYKESLILQDIERSIKIFAAVDKITEAIKNPRRLNILIQCRNIEESYFSIYSSICIFLAEAKELIPNDIDVKELSHQYMRMIKTLIENQRHGLPNSLFGGLSDVGFGLHSLSTVANYHKNFIDSLNELILDSSKKNIKEYKRNLDDVKISSFDTISGLTGILVYLLFYKDEKDIRNHIKEALSYLVSLTHDREVYGHLVPNYYISSKNQLLDIEKDIYVNGNFNFGLSHGTAGILAALSIALLEGVEVIGQKRAIERILDDLKRFHYVDNNGAIYWPGIIKFEDYINGHCIINGKRAGWCYGSPGIARAMYIAGNAIDDKEAIELSLKAIDGLCNMKEEDWKLNSPTICHGYAGLLTVVQAMYKDTGNDKYKECVDRLIEIILSLYEENSVFGFKDVNYLDKNDKGIYELVREDRIGLLQGSIGVTLALLTAIRGARTNWLRHLLIT